MSNPNGSLLTRTVTARADDAAVIISRRKSISAKDILAKSSFRKPTIFQNANVMVAVSDALACALTLLELDGVAARLVVCPPQLSGADLEAIARQSDAHLIVKDRSDSGNADSEITVFEELAHDRRIASEAVPIFTEWVLLTSGTTGTPKLVSHSFDSLTSNIKKPRGENGKIVWASFNDIRRFSGLQMFLQAMLTGSTLVLREPDETIPGFIKTLASARATHVSGTPTHWRKVLMYPERSDFAFEQITLVGEIADQALLDALRQEYLKANLTHIYGSTETGTGFSVHDGRAGFPKSFIGRDFGGAEFAVDGECLKVRSVRAARKYIGIDQVLQDEAGFIDTGDAVQLVGDRYFFLGRRTGTVNIGGSHVHPEEVEGVLNSDPRVHLSRVFARKNPFTGAILVADVVVKGVQARRDDNAAISASLTQYCRSQLAEYKVPALIRIVDDIEQTASGKLERRHA